MTKTIPGAETMCYTLFWQSKMRAYSYEPYHIIKKALKTCQDTSKKQSKMIKTIPGGYTLFRPSKMRAHSYEIYYITKNM